jgi:hypothetical protein
VQLSKTLGCLMKERKADETDKVVKESLEALSDI